MSSESPASGWQRLGSVLAIIGTFLAVGPLIGLVTFAAAIAGFGLFSAKPGDYAAAGAAMLVYGLFFAHFTGALPAIGTGAAVAIFAAVRRAVVPVWLGAAAGWAASAFALSPESIERPSADIASVVVWLIVVAGMLAGALCTRLTRRWHQRVS